MSAHGVVIVGLICAALGFELASVLWYGRGAFDDHTAAGQDEQEGADRG